MADPVWGRFEPPADENRRLRTLLRRWVRMEKEVLPPDELAQLCDDTRRVLAEPALVGIGPARDETS